MRQSVEWEESLCHMFARTETVSPGRTTFGGYERNHGDGNKKKKRHCSWWCAVCGGKYERRGPKRILVVQLGTTKRRQKFSGRRRSRKDFVRI